MILIVKHVAKFLARVEGVKNVWLTCCKGNCFVCMPCKPIWLLCRVFYLEVAAT